MNFGITVGRMGTFLVPAEWTEAYAGSHLDRLRLATLKRDERLAVGGEEAPVAVPVDARAPTLWSARSGAELIGRLTPTFRRTGPGRVMVAGAQWVDTSFVYDGLLSLLAANVTRSANALQAGDGIALLGEAYVDDAVRRILTSYHFDYRNRSWLLADLGDPAIPTLRRIVETDAAHRATAINALILVDTPDSAKAIFNLLLSKNDDVRFAVADACVHYICGGGRGVTRIRSFTPGDYITAFAVYGAYLLARHGSFSNEYERTRALKPYEAIYLLTGSGGVIERRSVIPTLVALTLDPRAHADLRTRAAQLLFGFQTANSFGNFHWNMGWVEEPALWACKESDPRLRLAYLATLRGMAPTRAGQLYKDGVEGEGKIVLYGGSALPRVYPEHPDWKAAVRQFLRWEEAGFNDTDVVAAANRILNDEPYTYKEALGIRIDVMGL